MNRQLVRELRRAGVMIHNLSGEEGLRLTENGYRYPSPYPLPPNRGHLAHYLDLIRLLQVGSGRAGRGA